MPAVEIEERVCGDMWYARTEVWVRYWGWIKRERGQERNERVDWQQFRGRNAGNSNWWVSHDLDGSTSLVKGRGAQDGRGKAGYVGRGGRGRRGGRGGSAWRIERSKEGGARAQTEGGGRD